MTSTKSEATIAILKEMYASDNKGYGRSYLIDEVAQQLEGSIDSTIGVTTVALADLISTGVIHSISMTHKDLLVITRS